MFGYVASVAVKLCCFCLEFLSVPDSLAFFEFRAELALFGKNGKAGPSSKLTLPSVGACSGAAAHRLCIVCLFKKKPEMTVQAFKKTNQNVQEVQNEHFLISTVVRKATYADNLLIVLSGRY